MSFGGKVEAQVIGEKRKGGSILHDNGALG